MKYDIAVIGGGASGLTAAISAAEIGGLKVAVIERLPRTGKKILATGNGRCNLGNKNISAEKYHGDAEMARKLIEGFETEKFFKENGLVTACDNEGRLYPHSNAATSVLTCLRNKMLLLGVDEICDFRVTDIRKNNYFIITSDKGSVIEAEKVILAAGGYASPSNGTDGDGQRLVKRLNIACVSPLPSLCRIKVPTEEIKGLKGIRVNGNVTAEFKGKKLKTENGEIQFGDGVISGICVFNLSRLASESKCDSIYIDLMPDYDENEVIPLINRLYEMNGDLPLEDFLCGVFQKRVGICLLKRVTENAMTDKTKTLTESQRMKLSKLIKHLNFTVTGTDGFNSAQVTAGGVKLSETDENLMSKKIKGLYFAGELLNIDGDCGGYNLHFAWASGNLVGKSAAYALKGEI